MQDLALHLGVIGLAIALAQPAPAAMQRMFERALAAGPIWLAALTVLLYSAALVGQQPLNARSLHLAFDNPRFLNHAQTPFVPWLAVVFVGREPQRWWRHLALVAAGFHVGLAYLDVSRGTGLAWLVALAALLAGGARTEARRFALTLAGGLLFGVLAFDVLPAALDRSWDVPFARVSEIGSTHSRNVLWMQALQMIQTSPWLGAGPMEFAALTDAQGAHPHNVYLQWAAEYGLPAALLAAWLLAKPVLRGLAHGAGQPRRTALAAICAAALVDACVSGNFVMPVSQLWIACMYGQLLACDMPPGEYTAPATMTRLWLALLLTSQAWLLVVSLQQGLCPEPHVPYPGRPPKITSEPKPRFWLNGQL